MIVADLKKIKPFCWLCEVARPPGTDKADLFREAMNVFVRVQAGKRLAAMGGKMPRLKSVPRRRPL
jgi:hypothetical protein